MSFFGKILEKLGFGGTAENPTTVPTSGTRLPAPLPPRLLRRLSSPSPSSMSSHNWNSAQRLTRRSLTGAHPS